MATGQLVLAMAAKRIAFGGAGLVLISSAVLNKWLWVGIALYIFATALWLYILSFVPLRYAYPIAATSIALAPLFEGFITGDFPAPKYWLGLSAILFGVGVVTSR